MPSSQPWKNEGMNKSDWVAKEVAKTVKAGKEWDLETVDFSDPNRPLTCLEVDFPIIPVNQIAAIEGNAGKPIYQMSKWWARRRSSVFRSLLLAAATKAPDDPSEAAKLIWDAYYGKHQANSSFNDLKVIDIFMGGGTTIVEGARLGMNLYGNDLNPVAWFITKNETARVSREAVDEVLKAIYRNLRPQITPFYSCNCPRGHTGSWTSEETGEAMPQGFDPASLEPDERYRFRYHGPEIVYAFWAKHGPCQTTSCGHLTPVMGSPLIAYANVSVNFWEVSCSACGTKFDLEDRHARISPSSVLVTSESERPFAAAQMDPLRTQPVSSKCPNCGVIHSWKKLGKAKKKKILLNVLMHPKWIRGASSADSEGNNYGGRCDDELQATQDWNTVRSSNCELLEYRGALPDCFTIPSSGEVIYTGGKGGSIGKRGAFRCGSCGAENSLSDSIEHSNTDSPIAMYAIQGYCPECEASGEVLGGRFFVAADDATQINRATIEWRKRSVSDLSDCFPEADIEFSHMTHQRDPLPKYGISKWRMMFNVRQLLCHGVFVKEFRHLMDSGETRDAAEFALGAFQQFLRNQSMLSFWHISKGHFAPGLSNANFHPYNNIVEVGALSPVGYGPWPSAAKPLLASVDWINDPWELVASSAIQQSHAEVGAFLTSKSTKVRPGDSPSAPAALSCGSSSDLSQHNNESFDMVITDPPFGGNLQYAEVSDFFYVWLKLVLGEHYPEIFGDSLVPKSLEAVSNRARNPINPDEFYARLLTACWKEAHRILKPGGIMAFTFHHSEDAPWVSVLEALFDAGYILEATYPIRSDETKGKGEFGSKKIEYDIIHVCRKRMHDTKSISWAKMRRQVLQDVRRLQEMLEHHQDEGLPEADIQVIRRGKALEYFSRHYGKVYKDPNTPMTVLEALLGINQLLDEEAGGIKEAPPHNAEPFTRMLLRLFDGIDQLPRDQMQKFLRGTGSAPSDYVSRGWVSEKNKIFYLTPALEIARNWVGKLRKGMTSDYDQAMFLIGACIEGSGINANETLNNDNFLPHPALGSIVMWFKTHGADNATRNAASRAEQLYQIWESKNQKKVSQLSLFESLGEEGA